jgi:hypothetical protein
MASVADTAAQGAPAVSDVLASAIPGILSRARIVISPYPFGVSDADNLRIVSVNAAAGVTVEIHGRQAQGGLDSKPFRFVHTPNTNRTAKTEDFVLGGGLVTNLSIFASAGAPLIGQCFVIVQLVRSLGATAYVMGTLLQGYVTTTQNVGWPGSAIVSSTDGEPVVRTIIGTAPGGGADIVETVPNGARWELLSVRAVLTLGGAAAATSGYFSIDDGTNIYAQVRTGNSGGLGTVNPFVWSQDVQPNNVTVSGGQFNLLPLTPNRMLAGHRFTLANDNAAGQKTWAAPVYNVKEWQEAG